MKEKMFFEIRYWLYGRDRVITVVYYAPQTPLKDSL